MEKVVRIGKLNEQDQFRHDDLRKMTPNERVNVLLTIQANYLRWDLNPRIKRVGKLKRFEFKDVS